MKIYLLKAKVRYILPIAVAVALFAGIVVLMQPEAVKAAASPRELPIYCVDRPYNTASLSFDAAWGNAILRKTLLKHY